MPDVLVDTDVLIDHLRGHRQLRAAGRSLQVSVITRAELFAGASSHADAAALRLLLGGMQEVPVDAAIAERAGELRRDHGVRLGDALIAATALESGWPLLTRSRRGFAGIPGLRLRAT